jgi:hypothetical protein
MSDLSALSFFDRPRRLASLIKLLTQVSDGVFSQPPFLFLLVVEEFPNRNFTQPCKERATEIECVRFEEGLDQRFLGDFSGDIRVAGHLGQESQEFAFMGRDERLEGFFIPFGNTSDKLSFVCFGVWHEIEFPVSVRL